MSRDVIAPKSFPSSPARAGRVRETAAIFSARDSAVFRAFFARASMTRLSCSRVRTFRISAGTASCFGIRKLRPYPSATLTISPAFPSFSTSSRRMTFIGLPLPDLRGGERDERHDAGFLDLHRQLPLVLGAGPRDAPRDDLPALGDEMLEHVHVLVVELEVLLRAEAAELLPHVPFLLSASGAAVRSPSAGAGFRRGAHRFPRLLEL